MNFNWDTKYHGKCEVLALLGSEQASIVISWGKKEEGSVVEYRISNSPLEDPVRRLETATRLAMGHFDTQAESLPALVNLAIDPSSVSWEGKIPTVDE